jgi:hypothetical protein
MLVGWQAATAIALAGVLMASFYSVCCPHRNHQCSTSLDSMQRVNCSGLMHPYAQRLLARNLNQCERAVICWGKGRGLAELASLDDEKNSCAAIPIELTCMLALGTQRSHERPFITFHDWEQSLIWLNFVTLTSMKYVQASS